MKKFIAVIALLLVSVVCLVACDKGEDLTLTEKTVDITTAEELSSMLNCLGVEYSKYTFVLKNDVDLAGAEWTPVGRNSTEAFFGTFDGNGKTISNFKITEDYAYAGLFGYTFNARIHDLSVSNVKIEYYTDEIYTHAGALVGYAYGDTEIKNVKISGVTIGIGTTIPFTTYVDTDIDTQEVFTAARKDESKQTQYLGGALGYCVGDVDVDSITAENISIDTLIGTMIPVFEKKYRGETEVPEIDESSTEERTIYKAKSYRKAERHAYDFNFIISEESAGNNVYLANNSFAGGVIGFAKGVFGDSTLKNVTVKGTDFDLYARSVIAGNAYGAVYSANVTDSTCEDTEMTVEIPVKGVAGGLIGLSDQTKVENTLVNGGKIWMKVDGMSISSYTVGGLIGYANDYSKITATEGKTTEIKDFFITSDRSNQIGSNYPVIGGICGTVRDSIVEKTDVIGGGIKNVNEELISEDDNYTHTAGLVAYVYGNATIRNCTSSFHANVGVTVSCSNTEYINKDGYRTLRFVRESNPHDYYCVYAKVESGKLVLEILDDSAEVLESVTLDSYVGDANDIKSLQPNYFNAEQGKFTLDVEIDGKPLSQNVYRELSGEYTITNVTYNAESVLTIPESHTQDGDIVTFNGGENILTK